MMKKFALMPAFAAVTLAVAGCGSSVDEDTADDMSASDDTGAPVTETIVVDESDAAPVADDGAGATLNLRNSGAAMNVDQPGMEANVDTDGNVDAEVQM